MAINRPNAPERVTSTRIITSNLETSRDSFEAGAEAEAEGEAEAIREAEDEAHTADRIKAAITSRTVNSKIKEESNDTREVIKTNPNKKESEPAKVATTPTLLIESQITFSRKS